MTENSTKILHFSRQESAVSSLNRKREQKYNRPHCIIPTEDLAWVINQAKTIQNLWHECWKSDPFGSRWVRLETSLPDRTFRLARKILYDAGLFQFKPEKDISDTRKTTGWMVINLHGARRIEQFWNCEQDTESVPPIAESMPPIAESMPISGSSMPPIAESMPPIAKSMPPIAKSMPISGSSMPHIGTVLPHIGTVLPPICSKTLENTGVSEPLSNSSLSFQEHLKDVHEKDNKFVPPNEPLGGVPPASGEKEGAGGIAETIERLKSNGTKAGQALAAQMQVVLSRLQGKEGEADEDYYKSEFKRRFLWDIPKDKLAEFLKLSQQLRALFLDWFDERYRIHAGYLGGCSRSFEEAIKPIRENPSRIIENINELKAKHNAYWEECARRAACNQAT